jgi:hypothetical protein
LLYALLVLAVATGIAVLCVLSALREIVILRGEVTALSQLITSPPEPAIMNSKLPQRLQSFVAEITNRADTLPADASSRTKSAIHCIVFMSEDCGPCRDLSARLGAAAEVIPGFRENVSVVVTIRGDRTSTLGNMLNDYNISHIQDSGDIAKLSGVRGTPMMIGFDAEQDMVTEYTYGGDEQWIIARIIPNGLQVPTTGRSSSAEHPAPETATSGSAAWSA